MFSAYFSYYAYIASIYVNILQDFYYKHLAPEKKTRNTLRINAVLFADGARLLGSYLGTTGGKSNSKNDTYREIELSCINRRSFFFFERVMICFHWGKRPSCYWILRYNTIWVSSTIHQLSGLAAWKPAIRYELWWKMNLENAEKLNDSWISRPFLILNRIYIKKSWEEVIHDLWHFQKLPGYLQKSCITPYLILQPICHSPEHT